MEEEPRYDEIGYWSEIKLDIIREYAASYSQILAAQENPSLSHIYIDAFAGAGLNISKRSGEMIPGSPLNALSVTPPFKEYHLIDLEKSKVNSLKKLVNDRDDVFIYEGDCNSILLEKVLPRALYKDYKRALCILDPYGLHLKWEVLKTIGQMVSVEIFLNFSVYGMNRNALQRDPEKVDQAQIDRMNSYWGDESWRDVAYDSQPGLFGNINEKVSNDTIAEAFRQRLLNVAGFKYVPKPMAMKNSKNAVIYYLFFASHKPMAADIVGEIFDKYRIREIL